MKIYSRSGDEGSTGIIGGRRLRKSDPNVICTGSIDELNCAIGLAACANPGPLLQPLRTIQSDLFILGSQLAATAGAAATSQLPSITESMVQRLEQEIDSAESALPELRQFILPAGTELACRLHMARAICRRAETALVALADHRSLPALAIPYLNRLSDWLFMQARLANHHSGVEDLPWHRPA